MTITKLEPIKVDWSEIHVCWLSQANGFNKLESPFAPLILNEFPEFGKEIPKVSAGILKSQISTFSPDLSKKRETKNLQKEEKKQLKLLKEKVDMIRDQLD
jgi:hypothetical protein